LFPVKFFLITIKEPFARQILPWYIHGQLNNFPVEFQVGEKIKAE